MLNTIVHGDPTDKPKLLIAHGLFGSARNWGVIAKQLSEDRQVIAVDLRNHGTSPWFETHSYENMAADLAEVIDGPTDVLGHSMGGKATMVLACEYPNKVNKLIVADIAPVTYTHTQMGPLEAMRGMNLEITSRAEAKAQLTGLEPGVDDFLLQSLDLKEKKWRLNLDILAAEMPKIIGFPPIDSRFEGDTLFLSGGTSTYVKTEHRTEIKRLFPNAKFAKIPGAGHWLHAEKPREFTESVAAFLNMA